MITICAVFSKLYLVPCYNSPMPETPSLPNGPYREYIERHAGTIHPTSGEVLTLNLIDMCPADRFLQILGEFVVHRVAYLNDYKDYDKKFPDVADYVETYQMQRTMVMKGLLEKYIRKTVAEFRENRRKKPQIVEQHSLLLKRLEEFLRRFVDQDRYGRDFRKSKGDLVDNPDLIRTAFGRVLNAKRPDEDTWKLFEELFAGYQKFLFAEI